MSSTALRWAMYDLASRSVSILDNFLFFGSVGIKSLKVLNAELTLVLMMTVASRVEALVHAERAKGRKENVERTIKFVKLITKFLPCLKMSRIAKGNSSKVKFLCFFLALSTNDDDWLDYLCVRWRSLIFASRLDGDISWIFFFSLFRLLTSVASRDSLPLRCN